MVSASSEHLRYLRVLAQQYPTVAAAASEIVRIEAILRLPKGTEHFMSDLHGEHEAFVHILNSASGVIREKIDIVLGPDVPAAERAELATLVYYPAQKLPELKEASFHPAPRHQQLPYIVIIFSRHLGRFSDPAPLAQGTCSPFFVPADQILRHGAPQPLRSRISHSFFLAPRPLQRLRRSVSEICPGKSKQRSRRPERSAGRANAKRCDEKMRRKRRIRPDEITFVWTDGRLSECPHCPPYSRGTCVP